MPAIALFTALLLRPIGAEAAPAIEQYVLDLPRIDRPDAGGAAIDPVRVSSSGGVAGEHEQAISGLESLLDAVTEPAGISLLALLLGGAAVTLGVRSNRGSAA